MRPSIITLGFVSFLCLGITTVTPAHAQTAEQLISLTGLAHELAFDISQNREVLKGQCLASEWCRAYGDQVARALEDAETTLRLGPLALPVLEEMLEVMDEAQRRELFAFYVSDLGKKIVELERRSRDNANLAQVAAEGDEIYRRQSDERIALIEDYDSITDSSVIERINDRLAKNIVNWLTQQAQENGLEPAETKNAVPPKRDRHTFHQRLCLMFESLSEEEMTAYVDFLRSDAGEYWFSERRDIRRRAVRAAANPILAQLMERLTAESK